MKIFVGGSCVAQNIYSLVDPTTFSEAAFELHVIKALSCVYPDYLCVNFKGAFEFEQETYEADLALVHRTWSHWFILEVELLSHSLHDHVVPQVRSFRYGRPLDSCLTCLCQSIPEMTRLQAASLIHFVPRSVAVIANRSDELWVSTLRGIDAQFMTVSVFTRADGSYGHETDGTLYVPQVSLGFFQYSAPNRTIRVDRSCSLPEGIIQMEDPYGSIGLWTVRSAEGALWVTKNVGDPGIPDKGTLQILRTHRGQLTMRLPRLPL